MLVGYERRLARIALAQWEVIPLLEKALSACWFEPKFTLVSIVFPDGGNLSSSWLSLAGWLPVQSPVTAW